MIDSLLTANHKVATPFDRQQRERVTIAASLSDDHATAIFGGWGAPRPYVRIVPQPNGSER